MWADLFPHIIIAQLNNLYSLFPPGENKDWLLKSTHPIADYSMVYDFLKNEKVVDLSLEPEIKKVLWGLAVKEFNANVKYKRWIKESNDKEWLKTQLNKVMASYVIRWHLGIKLYNEGLRMNVTDENGQVLKQIEWIVKK